MCVLCLLDIVGGITTVGEGIYDGIDWLTQTINKQSGSSYDKQTESQTVSKYMEKPRTGLNLLKQTWLNTKQIFGEAWFSKSI